MSLSAAIAQTDGVLIDYTGATRDNSAVLEANSTQQGVLVPRMTLAQRDLIATPAHSLLIYQTDNTPGYYFNSGTPGSPVWQRLFSGSGSPVTGSGAATRVAFWDAANSLSSNANLYWDNGNSRLGIGTATPAETVHINGAVRGNQAGALRISTGTGYVDVGPMNASWSHFQTDRPRFYFNRGITVDEGLIGSYDEDLSLQTSGTTRISVLNSNGFVGIGQTAPGSQLHVGATGWSANQLHFSSGWTAAGYHATIGSGYTGITASGIMLGTPHVPYRSGFGAKVRYASDQAASFYWDLGINAEAGGALDRFDLNRNNANLISILSNGNMGIGNIAPSRKLEVNGAIKLAAGNQIYIGESVTNTGKIGINFHTDADPNYWIGKPAGAWTQPLHIAFYTGIRVGAHTSYGGTRFYNSSNMATQIMSIGDGDNHVRVNNYLFAQYLNSSDNSVGSGVTGIMVKAGDNYFRTGTAAAVASFLGTSLAGNYIQNQNGGAQGANFWVSGNGRTDGGLTTGVNGTYNYFHSWTNLPNFTGFYSGHNGAHIYPNNGSYGSWRMDGSRNTWHGLEFGRTTGGNITLMTGTTGQGWGGMTTGMHANSHGWLWRFEHQTLHAAGMVDTDNTNYYMNPNGTSRLNVTITDEDYTYGWFRNYTAVRGLYNQATGRHFYSADASYWTTESPYGMIFRNGYQSTVNGYVYANNGGGSFGLLSPNGNWKVRTDNSGGELYDVFYANDFRPYIIYDRNNTGYYADINGNSRMANIHTDANLLNWPGYNGLAQANGHYVWPGRNDGGGSWQQSWYLASHGSYGLYTNTGLRFDGTLYAQGNTVIDAAGGWHRSYGSSGWYNGTYGGGWFMQDGTFVTGYGNKTIRNDRGGAAAAVWYGDTWAQGYWATETYSPGDWWYANYNRGYVYATTYGYLSTRKSKKDIRRFDETDYESALAFMDDLHLNYYVSKDDHMGTTRVGFIAEETPGNLTVPGKQGVLYGELGIYNTGAIRVLKNKVAALEQQLSILSDFGVGLMSSDNIWVEFTPEFSELIGGEAPAVVVTPSVPNVNMSVIEVGKLGFRVHSSLAGVTFSWVAMANVPVKEDEAEKYSERFAQMLESAEFDANNRPLPKFTEKGAPVVEDSSAPWSGTGNGAEVTLVPPIVTPSSGIDGYTEPPVSAPGSDVKDTFIPPSPVPVDAPMKEAPPSTSITAPPAQDHRNEEHALPGAPPRVGNGSASQGASGLKN